MPHPAHLHWSTRAQNVTQSSNVLQKKPRATEDSMRGIIPPISFPLPLVQLPVQVPVTLRRGRVRVPWAAENLSQRRA
ncbi:hypothetical protein ACN38_g1625 [Penicillium nordicum]|uniref:Uncharacterized protein n=1 Tax=Penicillium nordicum TaxID=229535 RepID=A0A0M8PG55_9EURO|nr:hypothetical protein ACN38_g1625 [Penicillium nordicum]